MGRELTCLRVFEGVRLLGGISDDESTSTNTKKDGKSHQDPVDSGGKGESKKCLHRASGAKWIISPRRRR